jgi:hypothetical protein
MVDMVDLATIPGFDAAERYVTAKIFGSDKIGLIFNILVHEDKSIKLHHKKL